jgi:hypothetical protein
MMNVCPECGKRHVVHWPEFWPYRRGKTFYCSRDCEIVSVTRDLTLINDVARARRQKKLKAKDYSEIAREMIRIKESGGGNKEIYDFLEASGYKNPEAQYYYLRQQLKKNNPDLYEQLAAVPAKKEAPKAPKAELTRPAVELVYDESIAEEYRKEQQAKAAPKKPTAEEIAAEGMIPVMTASGPIAVKPIMQPVVYDGMTIREVEGIFGRYRYSDIGSAVYIDFESPDGVDVLSYTVEQWRKFREEQEKAAAILGVEL